MKKILLGLLLSTTAFAASLRTNVDQQLLNAKAPRNYILNSGAESNKLNVTDASLIVTRTTSSPLEGDGSFAVDSTGAAEVVEFLGAALQPGLHGQSCEASFVYSGDASLYEAYATLNSVQVSDTATLINASTAQVVSLVFPCGSSATDVASIVIESTGDGAAIKVDSVYIGAATSLGAVAQSYFIGSIKWAQTTSCNWSTVSTSLANFANDNECDDNARVLKGLASDPTAGLRPAIGFPYRGPGLYRAVAVGNFVKDNGASSKSVYRFSDGTNAWDGKNSYGQNQSEVSYDGVVVGEFVYDTFSGSIVTLDIQAATTNASASARVDPSQTDGDLVISVYYYPSSSQVVVRGDVTDLSGVSKSPATASCAWTSTSASMAAFSADADCPVPTVSGNVTAPATKIPGFIATNILPGKYTVTATGNFATGGSTSGQQFCKYEIYDGTNSGGTQAINQAVNVGVASSPMISGTFEYTAKQSNVAFQVRAQRTSGNAVCAIDSGSNDLTFTLTPISQGLPKPFIPGSIYTNSPWIMRHEYASMNAQCTVNGVCATADKSDGITITRTGTGLYTATFSPAYQAVPACNVTSNRVVEVGTTPTTSSYSVSGFTSASVVPADISFQINCFGRN